MTNKIIVEDSCEEDDVTIEVNVQNLESRTEKDEE